MPVPDPRTLTGQAESHLCSATRAALVGTPVHRDVVEPLLHLTDEAKTAGFDLRVLSGFRSFDRQLSIWNRKATGKLAVLDSDAVPLDIAQLTEPELAFAILRWSALPGASRHHWGTDLDVYDAKAQPAGYEIALIPEEVEAGGMFAPLHEWLDARMAAGRAFGFFRPYDQDRGGVAPERWHLSHGPVAAECQLHMTPDLLRDTVAASPLELKDTVLDLLDEIYERFVININGQSP